MIFRSLRIGNGLLFSADDSFSEKTNLLFSKDNSVGKTTYLRILFYSFGYQIPSMFGLNFEKLETELCIEQEGKTYLLRRKPKILEVEFEGQCENYSLPFEQNAFLMRLFGIDNEFVITNLLGIMYVDQEKGWTLLNRGVVIGKNRFDIDELLMGLGNIDCKEEILLKNKLEKENKKYKSIVDIDELKNEILETNKDFSFSDFEQEIKRKTDYCNLQIQKIKQDIKSIDNVINKNESLFKYLTNLHLFIETDDGKEIPINEKTLRGAQDTNNLLRTRKSILSIDLSNKEKELVGLRKELDDYYLKNNDLTKLFDEGFQKDDSFLFKSIASLDIKLSEINAIISENSKTIANLKETIGQKIAGNHKLISDIFGRLYRYCEELGISSKVVNDPKFLYTDKLKYYSGTDFHKLVIAFKVALHLSVEEYLGTHFPFVLDSPSGRELNENNIELTVNFVKRELQDSQLFFASINDFGFEKTLYFKKCAIEDHSIPIKLGE